MHDRRDPGSDVDPTGDLEFGGTLYSVAVSYTVPGAGPEIRC